VRSNTEEENAMTTRMQLSGPTVAAVAAADRAREPCGRRPRGPILPLLPLLALVAACGQLGRAEPKFDTPYQAVFLTNGQVFFGKLSGAGSDNPRLDDVFYVQTQVNPDTKQTTSVLIRRGKEWHGPAYMYVNSRSILVIEPVSADSKVAQLIAEAQKQGAK
jgi:hypothetical protein